MEESTIFKNVYFTIYALFFIKRIAESNKPNLLGHIYPTPSAIPWHCYFFKHVAQFLNIFLMSYSNFKLMCKCKIF